MTRRHFQALAHELMLVRPEITDAHYQTWMASVRAVATACAASNPRFDRDKFVDACTADNYNASQHGR